MRTLSPSVNSEHRIGFSQVFKFFTI